MLVCKLVGRFGDSVINLCFRGWGISFHSDAPTVVLVVT
jgi:hypothetical protein